jgi:hypothetical protein
MVLRLSELNREKREEFPHPKVGFITSTFNISITASYGEVYKYWSGCLGGDDNIYFGASILEIEFQNELGNILKFDPKTENTTKFIIDGEELGFGALICGKDGNVYTIPGVGTTIYKIDVSNQSCTPLVNTNLPLTTLSSNTTQLKYMSGCLSSNGSIYAVPAYTSSVLKINPSVGTVSTFGTVSGGNWIGAVFGPDGCIYGIPNQNTTILKINPQNDTISTFGNVTGGWVGGCLAPNGKIYCPPRNPNRTSSVLKIDPIAETVTTFGSIDISFFTEWLVGGVFPTNEYVGWQGAVLAPNGKIYCSPLGGKGILEINPEDDTVNVIGVGSLPPFAEQGSSFRWSPFVMAPDGKMYAPPTGETKILVLGETSNQEPADWLLSPYCNKGP